MDQTPIRLLTLIKAREDRCEAIEGLAIELMEIAKDHGHCTHAELMRDVNDSCRFVMNLDFASEENLEAFFVDPARLAALKDLPENVHQDVQRFELAPITARSRS